MSSSSGTFIPTAIIASVVTFLLTVIRDWISKWRTSLSEMKKSRIEWYEEVIRISREIQIDVMAARATLSSFESMAPESEDEAMRMIDSELISEGIDADVLNEDNLEEDILEEVEGEFDNVVELVRDGLRRNLQTESTENRIQQDLLEFYSELKSHWASVDFDIPSETEKILDDFMAVLYTSSLYPGLDTKDEELLDNVADRVKSRCNSDIRHIESARTKSRIEDKFG
jgi:Arc/MetJ-type ribon-helix-helix transcriptional regulator